MVDVFVGGRVSALTNTGSESASRQPWDDWQAWNQVLPFVLRAIKQPGHPGCFAARSS